MPDTPKLEPRTLTINELFTNADSWYTIPLYQRPYRWMDDEVDALWDDLNNAYKDEPKNVYFLGSIITAKQSGRRQYVSVIDGQQRLTTLIILFSVIRDLHPKINDHSTDDLAIKARHIENSIANQDGNRLQIEKRLLPDDSAASDFHEFVTNPNATITTAQLRRPSKKKLKGDIPGFNFINSVRFFHRKVNKYGAGLGGFVNFIFHQVQVIRIDCPNDESAVTIFQVLNDRGMDLKSSDMVKSFLLDKLNSTAQKETLEALQGQFMSDWRDMERDIAGNEDGGMAMDNMLDLYMCYNLANAPGKNTFKKFKDYFGEAIIPNTVLKDFKIFSEKYDYLISEKNKALYALRYTSWGMLWKSVLLTARHLKYDDSTDVAKLAESLRRYYYICWIAGRNFTTVKKLSFDIIGRLKLKDNIEQKSNAIEEIDGLLRNHVDANDPDSILKAAIARLQASDVDEPWIKPLLFLIEYNVTDDEEPKFLEMGKCHLEHVLPQKHNGEGWEHIEKSVAKEYLDSGGNLTLLSGKKNTIASNRPFSEKILTYKGKREKDGKITSFAITRRIVENNNNGEWDKKTMSDRKKWFLAEVSKILDIDAKEKE